MSDIQCGDPEGTVYVCEAQSIDQVGQDPRSSDCGYFAGYAIKAYHDRGGGHPRRATMSRYEVYGARNVVAGTTTRTFSTTSSLQPDNAGRYMASIGCGGYDRRNISLRPDRAYLRIVPDLCRDGNGIMFPSIGVGHWYSVVAVHNNRFYLYDPTPRRTGGDTEYHLASFDISNEQHLSSLDHFFGAARPCIVSIARSSGSTGGDSHASSGGTDDEAIGEWE